MSVGDELLQAGAASAGKLGCMQKADTVLKACP